MAFKDRLYEGIEAWNRGDVEAAVSRMHPDVVWETSGYFPGFDLVYRGKDGVRRFMTEFADAWEDIVIEVLEHAEPLPERIAVRARFKAHGRQGIPVDLEISHLYVGEGDLVIHFCAFPEWEDCAAAAADPTFGPDEAGRAHG
jgi:ketosteroid isomerase-like protein